MKLIDLLVQELPKRGGWPKSAIIAESYSHIPGVHFWDTNGITVPFDDLITNAIGKESVTREQCEAALAAAQQTVWNGEGLPPVGSLVEVSAEDFDDDWYTIKVAYVHNGVVAGIVQSENEYLNDQLEKFSAGYNRAKFRPIRSEADKKRDEAGEAIYRAINWNQEGAVERNSRFEDYCKAYDAIAAGKVPGVTIK